MDYMQLGLQLLDISHINVCTPHAKEYAWIHDNSFEATA